MIPCFTEIPARFFLKFILSVLIFPAVSLAQFENLQFRHITVEDGLAQSVVNAIFKDSHGFMWFSTYGGISRYDGVNVISNEEIAPGGGTISLCPNIIEDANNNIWFGSMEGLIKFDYATNKFFKYSRNDSSNSNVISTKGFYYPIAERQGKVLSTAIGLNEYYIFDLKTETFTLYDINPEYKNDRFSLAEIPADMALFRDMFVFVWEDKSVGTTFSYISSNNSTGGYQWVSCFTDRWFGKYIQTIKTGDIIHVNFRKFPAVSTVGNSSTANLITYDLKNNKILAEYSTNYSVNSFCFHNDNLYLGSEQSGVHILDVGSGKEKANIRYQANNPAGIMSDNAAFVSVFDNQLWISAWGEGVDYTSLSAPLFSTHFSAQQALANKSDNFIRGIVEDSKGNFWCNTLKHGIVQLDNDLHYVQTLDFTNKDEHPSLFIDGNDNIFFGSKGLLRYNVRNKKRHRFFYAQPNLNTEYLSNDFHYFHRDKSGKLWTASMLGIYEIDTTNERLINTLRIDTLLPNIQQFVFTDSKNNMYVYSGNYGLNIYSFVQGMYKKKYAFKTEFIPRHVYPQNDSILWFGTTSGLLKFNINATYEKWFTTKNGLPDNTIYAIAPDKFGKLWISTNKGLASFHLATEKIKKYTISFDQQGREYNRHAVCVARDGRILFGGINGITAVHPEVSNTSVTQPTIQFTTIQADVEINPFGHQNVAGQKRLPAGTTFIEFHFIAIDFFSSSECRLKYKLSNVDDTWRSAKNPGNARYVNLSPGKYMFEVLASDENGNWTKEAKIFYFEIDRFWWQTIWFKIAGVLAVLATIVLIIYLWFRQKLHAEKLQMEKQLAILREQERISADLHDDIGSTLSSISIYSELANKYHSSMPDTSLEMVRNISKQALELMSRIEVIIWSLKPRQSDLMSVKKKVMEFVRESHDISFIDFNVDIYEGHAWDRTSPDMRKNILLIIKEAIHNITKYSKATSAHITVHLNHTHININIKDNGIGFDMNHLKSGHGLENMKKRTTDLNGYFDIRSAPNAGTEIKAAIPFSKSDSPL